jgi:adenylosuccinate lyase
MQAFEENRSFTETLAEHPLVAPHLARDEIEQLLDPHRYTGLAGEFVDRVIKG